MKSIPKLHALYALVVTSLTVAAPSYNADTDAATLITRQTTCADCLRCTYSNKLLFSAYGVYVPDDKAIDLECGQGIHDNLNGRCTAGSITNFQCVPDPNGGPSAWVYFNAGPFCQVTDVANAIRAAGTGQGQSLYQDAVCGPEPAT